MKRRNNKLAPAIKRQLKLRLNVSYIIILLVTASGTILGPAVKGSESMECFATKPSNTSVAKGNSTAVFACEAADGINGAMSWSINGSYLLQLGPEHSDRYRAESTSGTGQPVHYLMVFTKGVEGLTTITCENTCGRVTAYLCVDCMDVITKFNGDDSCFHGKVAVILASLLIAVLIIFCQ